MGKADNILEIVPIVILKRKDEQKYGKYRTKRVILPCFDAVSEAMKTSRPYQMILDPPPADPGVAHPNIGEGQQIWSYYGRSGTSLTMLNCFDANRRIGIEKTNLCDLAPDSM